MGEERKPELSLRDAIAEGYARTEGMNQDQIQAENNGNFMEQAVPVQAEETPVEQNVEVVPEAFGNVPTVEQAVPAQTEPVAAPAAQSQTDQSVDMVRYLMSELEAQRQQNAALSQQLQQASGLVQEQSEAAQQNLDATTQPSITIPILDFNAMRYEDDETAEKMVKDWQTAFESALVQKITDQVAAQYARQMEPIREDWEKKQKIAAKNAAKSTIYGDERFSDFKDMDEQIERILGANPELNGMDETKRYLLGGLLARGLNYKSQPTAEDIVKMVQANPDAQRMLDMERARAINERNGQIPTIVPSSGYSTANAVPDESPKTLDDLHRRIQLGLSR